jgi:hypothetical protein
MVVTYVTIWTLDGTQEYHLVDVGLRHYCAIGRCARVYDLVDIRVHHYWAIRCCVRVDYLVDVGVRYYLAIRRSTRVDHFVDVGGHQNIKLSCMILIQSLLLLMIVSCGDAYHRSRLQYFS